MSDDDEDDGWDEEYPEDSDEAGTIPCPSCGAEIHEDSPRCPICGDYVISGTSQSWSQKPLWYAALAFAGIVAVVLASLLIW